MYAPVDGDQIVGFSVIFCPFSTAVTTEPFGAVTLTLSVPVPSQFVAGATAAMPGPESVGYVTAPCVVG